MSDKRLKLKLVSHQPVTEKDVMVEAAFEKWWHDFRRLAGIEQFGIGNKEEYREYFLDGDSPSVALDCEMDAAEEFTNYVH